MPPHSVQPAEMVGACAAVPVSGCGSRQAEGDWSGGKQEAGSQAPSWVPPPYGTGVVFCVPMQLPPGTVLLLCPSSPLSVATPYSETTTRSLASGSKEQARACQELTEEPFLQLPSVDSKSRNGGEVTNCGTSGSRTKSDAVFVCESVGTKGHPACCASPCKYAHKPKGCKDGESCTRCHYCVWTRGYQRRKGNFEGVVRRSRRRFSAGCDASEGPAGAGLSPGLEWAAP